MNTEAPMSTEVVSLIPETRAPATKSFTRFFPAIARILLGLPLVIFGLNGFLNFIPPPETALPARA